MAKQIKKVAVLGSGIMGGGIAALLAGAEIDCLLLDIVPKDADATPQSRNKLAIKGLENLAKSKPALIFSKSDLKRITPGNFEDDWNKLKDYDMVIEVVVERLDIKRSVFERLEKVIGPETIVASNTSGLPLTAMAEGRSKNFKKNFLITHFFNPVRYMKLVEVISGPETDPQTTQFIAQFLENTLGKGVVYAKDTPNFIANRIGTLAWVDAFKLMLEKNYTVDEVDVILGPALGKPKSAMFRTADLVGLDTLAHVIETLYQSCPNDEKRDVLAMPKEVGRMLENKWLGDKTKQGFYKKSKDASGKSQILTLDLKSFEYQPQNKPKFDSVGAVRKLTDAGEKIKTMINATDRAAEFAWITTRNTLLYAANRIPEIADDVVNVDNAMKWGFNWDIGPFETLDAIGVQAFAERVKKDGLSVPKNIELVLNKGSGVFYKKAGAKKLYFDLQSATYQEIPTKPNVIVLKSIREQNKVMKSNASASILDLGDGVLGLEFHSKMNAIDGDIGAMGMEAIELVKQPGYKGLVIANEGENFSVGANLMLIWLESTQKNFDSIEKLVKGFQDFCMALKYSPKPVVAAPFGLTLGGGCEICMGADQIRAAAETYIGLVEVGAGLIPGGGGNKNLLLNAEAALKAKGQRLWMANGDGGFFPKVQKAFQTIAFATVATSAKEGFEHCYLKKGDRISLSKDSLIYDAKQDVLALSKTYQPSTPRQDILVGGVGAFMAIKSALRGYLAIKQISEHDALVGEKLAWVLTAGKLPNQALVSEQYLLDIEREAFLSLCGEEKSQARMQALLTTGKPLRN
ncbi:MAG: 3-hydroxyacyl-CoA dehydrogenase/enoyl-CoA hydratase family protein [Deltaproteobacteria bacterium]|nr:3-hydroxyacyl-CoA dehydrogenase/enoyl-CoA hydratase family protein [Deltaproteobacteria bacterium]